MQQKSKKDAIFHLKTFESNITQTSILQRKVLGKTQTKYTLEKSIVVKTRTKGACCKSAKV